MRAQRIGRVLRKLGIEKTALKDAKNQIRAIESLFGTKGSGWIKKQFHNDNGRYCLLGAIEASTYWSDDDNQKDIVFTTIKAAIPGINVSEINEFTPYDWDVVNYNDMAEREFKSIKAVLKRAKKAINWALVGEKH